MNPKIMVNIKAFHENRYFLLFLLICAISLGGGLFFIIEKNDIRNSRKIIEMIPK